MIPVLEREDAVEVGLIVHLAVVGHALLEDALDEDRRQEGAIVPAERGASCQIAVVGSILFTTFVWPRVLSKVGPEEDFLLMPFFV